MSDSTGTRENAASAPLDPTFYLYRSAAEAAAAPTEELAYVVVFDRASASPAALTVVDVKESSPDFERVVGWADLPSRGNELHHFGWNACSSALMRTGHDMGPDGLRRRFLLMPGLRSSRVTVFDTHPDPRSPRLHQVIEAEELASKASSSRPHTLRCGPDGVFLSCLGGVDGADGAGGIALLDHDTDPVSGGLALDERFFPHGDAFRGRRVHQVRLQGGDASSDSYCYR
jgi:selenium-binding protein 1